MHKRNALPYFAPLVLPLILVLSFTANSQDTVTGAFEGTVSDSRTRARVVSALVEITNQASGVTIRRSTNAQGRFYQGLLPPGIYIIRVTSTGYKPSEKEQRLYTTGPNQVIPIPFSLEPDDGVTPQAATAPTSAPTPQTVIAVVPDEAEESRNIVAEINRSDARRGGAFPETEVSSIPLGSTTLVRSFDELALFLPGVALSPQSQGGGAGPGVGPGVGTSGQFAANGLRSRANNFTVDGSDNNDEDIGVRRQGFVALVPQPIESVEEYQAITLLAPAQFGRNLGAQVNAVSKSGGNATHGSLYGFFNSSQLNSRNFFDSPGPLAPDPLRAGGRPVLLNGRQANITELREGEDSFTLAQGGLTLGGPLVPSETSRPGRSLFYFLSAEGQLINATTEKSFAVPTIESRGLFGSGAMGLSQDPFGGGTVNAFPTTVSGDAIFSLFPFPNNPAGIYGPNTFTHTLPSGGQGKVISGKMDGNFRIGGRQQSLTARYNFTDDWRDIPATGGALFSTVRPRVRTQNFSTFLNSELSDAGSSNPVFNQLRASYGRTRLVFDELRDTSFLQPSRLANSFDPADRQFLLNARLFVNDTLPGLPNVLYDNFFNFTVEDILGPLGQVSVAGFSPVGVDVFNFPQRRINNTYQLADDVSWRRRKHSYVFGVDFRRTELNSDLPRNARPQITFGGAPRLMPAAAGGLEFRGFFNPVDLAAASAPSGVFQAVTSGQASAINLRYYQHNYFAQDTWQPRSDLSISLGLRYEYNSPPRETSGIIEETFDDPSLNLVPGLRQFIDGRERIVDPDRDNFAPRISFAYAPSLFGAERTTVLRAGAGVFYDQALGAVVSQSRNVFPNFLTLNLAGGISNASADVGFNITDPSLPFFPCREGNTVRFIPITQPGTLNTLNPAAPLRCLVDISSSFPGGFGFTLPSRRFEMPTAYHYALTYEQLLSRGLVVSVAYVGTQGRHLIRLTTPNLGPNAFLVPTQVNVIGNQPNVVGVALGPGQRIGSGGISSGRPVSQAGTVFVYESSANSRYDALQLQARGRLSSLQYQLAYTLSRVNDDVSDVFDLAGAPALPQNSLNFAGERGPANFDARHRFSSYAIYDFPSAGQGIVGAIAGGWRVIGTGRIQSGQPYTIGTIFDVNLDGNLTDRPNRTDGIVRTGDRGRPLRLTVDPVSLLAPVGQDGSEGRNTFHASSILELDLAVVKSFSVSSRQKILLRTEFLNFINRSNFGVPVRFLGAAGFGQTTETITPGRRVQFALKYEF